MKHPYLNLDSWLPRQQMKHPYFVAAHAKRLARLLGAVHLVVAHVMYNRNILSQHTRCTIGIDVEVGFLVGMKDQCCGSLHVAKTVIVSAMRYKILSSRTHRLGHAVCVLLILRLSRG